MRPWYKKKKVWGALLAAGVGLFGPALGATEREVLVAVISLLCGVGVEGVVDAAAALGRQFINTTRNGG